MLGMDTLTLWVGHLERKKSLGLDFINNKLSAALSSATQQHIRAGKPRRDRKVACKSDLIYDML